VTIEQRDADGRAFERLDRVQAPESATDDDNVRERRHNSHFE